MRMFLSRKRACSCSEGSSVRIGAVQGPFPGVLGDFSPPCDIIHFRVCVFMDTPGRVDGRRGSKKPPFLHKLSFV